jgi:hypothetical protein
MADYPDWVLKHKTKGTYVNRVGDKYYLYAAHSERIPGTKKVKRVHDGYIGRITEQNGLIPARDKVQGEVVVYEFGLSTVLLYLCDNVYSGLRRDFRNVADQVFVAGMLSAAYGDYSQDTYHWSYLSVKFPNLDMQKALTDKQRFGVQRCERMVKETVRKRFGGDAPVIMARLSRICKVKINGRFYSTALSDETKEWLSDQQIDWRDWYGKN